MTVDRIRNTIMPIPSEINALADRLNQELNQLEQEATEGVAIARNILDSFPNNARLIQFFAVFNNTIFFVETERRRIRSIVENLSGSESTTYEEIQEAGEDLASELGRVLEAKIAVSNLKNRLENLL